MNGMLLGRALACQRDAARVRAARIKYGSGERLLHHPVAANRVIAQSREAIATKAAGSQTTAGSVATSIASIAVPIHEQVSARIAMECITVAAFLSMSRAESGKHAN